MRALSPLSVAFMSALLATSPAWAKPHHKSPAPAVDETAPSKAPPGFDTLVLKSGSRIFCHIEREVPKKGVTVRLADGTQQTFKMTQISVIEYAEILPEPEPEVEPASPPQEPASPPSPRAAVHDRPQVDELAPASHHPLRFGIGAFGGVAQSKSLGPWFGANVVLEAGLVGGVYARLEPGVFLFTRATDRQAIDYIDARTDGVPPAVQHQTIRNNVLALGGIGRLELGYDFTPNVTARLGGIAGVVSARTSAGQCGDGAIMGPTYGATVTPIAARVGAERSIEIGALVEFLLVPVVLCDTPAGAQINVDAGTVTHARPVFVETRVQALTGGLSATYLF